MDVKAGKDRLPAGVIFVRHAMPDVIPGVAPALWRLGEHAKEDCVLLAHALPAHLGSPIVTSAHEKARETAVILGLRRGLEHVIDTRLRETEAPDAWVEGDFAAVVGAYLEGTVAAGWEPHEAVVARIREALVEGAARVPPHEDLVVVTHGRAMSLYLASLAPPVITGRTTEPFEVGRFWRGLGFPDAWRLDAATNTLTRVFPVFAA